jgi:RimJ/RimL family protein N-acetyltransferase
MPSLKVLAKAGYEQEGILRDKSCCGDGSRENMIMFAAIRTDWAA